MLCESRGVFFSGYRCAEVGSSYCALSCLDNAGGKLIWLDVEGQ